MKKAEEELAVKEEKLDALKQELLRPEYQSSYSKLTEIQGEIDALEEEIMADMENWEALSQPLEELAGKRLGIYRQKYDVRYCVVSYRSKNMEKDTMVVSIEVKT